MYAGLGQSIVEYQPHVVPILRAAPWATRPVCVKGPCGPAVNGAPAPLITHMGPGSGLVPAGRRMVPRWEDIRKLPAPAPPPAGGLDLGKLLPLAAVAGLLLVT